MKFKDIPQFPSANYKIDVSWSSLESYLKREDPPFVMEPDYQREHVWTDEQRIAFIEYGLMGGENGMKIITNCPGWMDDFRGPYELVDGLQRITAVLKFLKNELPAFGFYYKDFSEQIPYRISFHWHVLNLSTRKDILNLYLLVNSGGTPHSAEEIIRVRKLYEKELK